MQTNANKFIATTKGISSILLRQRRLSLRYKNTNKTQRMHMNVHMHIHANTETQLNTIHWLANTHANMNAFTYARAHASMHALTRAHE